jgi:hypothetical protein
MNALNVHVRAVGTVGTAKVEGAAVKKGHLMKDLMEYFP